MLCKTRFILLIKEVFVLKLKFRGMCTTYFTNLAKIETCYKCYKSLWDIILNSGFQMLHDAKQTKETAQSLIRGRNGQNGQNSTLCI